MLLLYPQVDYKDSTVAAILIVNCSLSVIWRLLRNEDTLLSCVFAALY